jgi:hypothetical protein
MKLAELEVAHEDQLEKLRAELARGRAFERLNGEILATLVMNWTPVLLLGVNASASAEFDRAVAGWYARRAKLRRDTDGEAKIDASGVRVCVPHDGRRGVQGGAVRVPSAAGSTA